MAKVVLTGQFTSTFALVLLLLVGMCTSVPISGVGSKSQMRDSELEADHLKDTEQANSHAAGSAVIVPHYLVEHRLKFSEKIERNGGQIVDELPMYLHGQPASVKGKEHTHARMHEHTHARTHAAHTIHSYTLA